MTYLRNYRMALETVQCESIEDLIAADIKNIPSIYKSVTPETDGDAVYNVEDCGSGVFEVIKLALGHSNENILTYYPNTEAGLARWKVDLAWVEYSLSGAEDQN